MVSALREPCWREGVGPHSGGVPSLRNQDWTHGARPIPAEGIGSPAQRGRAVRMQGMGGIPLLGAGRGGSLISRSPRPERGSVPLWSPSPAGQLIRSSSEFYSKLALGSRRPHPTWNRGPLWTRSPTKLLGFQFFPVCSRPPGPSALSQGSLPPAVGAGADTAHS